MIPSKLDTRCLEVENKKGSRCMIRLTLFTIHGLTRKLARRARAILGPSCNRLVTLRYSGYDGWFGVRPRLKLSLGAGLERVQEELNQTIYNEHRVSNRSFIVAHGFGTVIIASVMQEFYGKKFDMIFFLGSALRRDFDWSDTLEGTQFCFERSRRQGRGGPLGKNGATSRALPLVGRLFCNLVGDAGRKGFVGPQDLVHNIPTNKSSLCEICDGEPMSDTAPLHNIEISGALHSDYFVDPQNIHELIIPILFGIDPDRYVRYIELCRLAAEHDLVYGSKMENHHETSLLNLPIEHQGGTLRTVGQQLRTVLDANLSLRDIEATEERRDQSIALLIKGVWRATCYADDHRDDVRVADALLPRKAMQKAITPLLDQRHWK